MINSTSFNPQEPLISNPSDTLKNLLSIPAQNINNPIAYYEMVKHVKEQSMATDCEAIIKALTSYPQSQSHLVTLSKKEIEATRKILKNNPGLTGMLPVKNGTLADGKDFIQIGVHRIVAA